MRSLPADLILNCKNVRFEIEDDPFEVKLSYNYALMVDEYFESVKRRQALDERRLIKDNHLETAAYEILKEREAGVYLQRSKKIYEKPIRTQLYTLVANDLCFYALADYKWYGYDNCVKLMKTIDSCSPLQLNPKYCFLWSRYVNCTSTDFKLILRDYTQPLMHLQNFHAWGNLVLSEFEPNSNGKRECKMKFDNDFEYIIVRSMSPVKFYHDLCSKMSLFQVAYGPSKENCMAQVNLSIDKIIHPTRDPSCIPLSWWDKVRLLSHGRFSIQAEQMQWIYHVSMDPYNRTEEMKWIWKDLYFDWFNSKMIFKGNLDVYFNTASKYDDCRILNWPDLEMRVNIEWLCKQNANPNAHNYVMLYAPEKVANPSKHDSYANFRSVNLNLNLSFISGGSSITDSTNCPTLKLYASTSRFLQRIKYLFTVVTRPIRRGKIFNNLNPRKPFLSRHFKYLTTQFDIPKLNIIYWSSASEQYGIQIECKKFYFESTHKLDVIQSNSVLIQRSQADWSLDSMRYRTTKTFIYLMSPSNEHKINLAPFSTYASSNTSSGLYNIDSELIMENERSVKFLDSKPAFRNFFLQVDMITYNRESPLETVMCLNKRSVSSSDDTNSKRSYPNMANCAPLHKVQIKNLKLKWNNINRDVAFTLYDIYNRAKLLRHNLSTQALKHFVFDNSTQQTNIDTSFTIKRDISISLDTPNQIDANNQTMFFSPSNENYFKESYVEELLEKLEAERGINSEIYTDEKPTDSNNYTDCLYGVHAATKMSDIIHQNIHIELINSQIKMNLQEQSNSNSGFNPKPKKKPSFNSKTNENLFNQNDHKSSTSKSVKQDDFIIISAAKANVFHRIHKPIFKSQHILDKFTWSGHVESMQYFATLHTSEQDLNSKDDVYSNDEYWLEPSIIDPNDNNFKKEDYDNKSNFFGIYCPRNPLGMIITPNSVNQEPSESNKSDNSPKLQLIVSKCRCEFYMVDFVDKILTNNENVDDNLINTETLLNSHVDFNSSFKEPIDCFTLIHYDLNLSTNSQQYKMILDIVNNLVLYFRPKRQHVIDRQKSIKFNLQLSGDIDSLKQHIQHQQIEIKELLCNLRSLERQIFYSTEKIQAEIQNMVNNTNRQQQMNLIQELKNENKNLESDYKECKKILSDLSDELNISITCYKELMLEKRISNPVLKSRMNLEANRRKSPNNEDNSDKSTNRSKLDETKNKKYLQDEYTKKSIVGNDIGRRYEIWFKHTQWKLTESDGLMGCAQFTMKNFLYIKLVNQYELDCVEHNLEIGSCRIQDLTPDQFIYNDVLKGQSPSDMDNFHMTETIDSDNNQIMFRLFCKERPPVGEIPVMEHLELNLAPLTIKLTHRFYLMMMKFFFTVTETTNNNNKNSKDIPDTTNNLQYVKTYSTNDIYGANFVNADQFQQMTDLMAINCEPQQQLTQFQQTHKKSKSFSNNFLVNTNTFLELQNDDVEIMKRRSANNKTFICIKIPEIPLLVSYKGNKDKNIKDLSNVRLIFPLFEVYNATWTWLDLINELKSHLTSELISQTIKYKLIEKPIKPINSFIKNIKYAKNKIINDEHENMRKILGPRFVAKTLHLKEKSPSKSNRSSRIIDDNYDDDQSNEINNKKSDFEKL